MSSDGERFEVVAERGQGECSWCGEPIEVGKRYVDTDRGQFCDHTCADKFDDEHAGES